MKQTVDYLASLWENKQRRINEGYEAPRRGVSHAGARMGALEGEARNREGEVVLQTPAASGSSSSSYCFNPVKSDNPEYYVTTWLYF